jgi:hypothetical protein
MTIEVDPQVFGDAGNGDDSCNEFVIIVGASDPDAAVRALARAGNRFYSVAEDGRELTPEEFEAEAGEIYTPNCVTDIRMAARGPWYYVDCKSDIEPPMQERMIAILVEELEREGVSARVEVPSDDETNWDAPVRLAL